MSHLAACRQRGYAHAVRARGYAHELGRSVSRSALYAPSPKDGEVRRTALPDTFDGIRFEIGRMCQYVKDARKDSVMLEHCRQVCAEYLAAAEERAERERRPFDRNVAFLQAAEAWCRENYVYVNDPPNIEVIQTPRRMVKWTRVPPEVIRHITDPLLSAMEDAAPGFDARRYTPPGICPGDCDEGSCLMVSHCVCIAACMGADIGPFRFRFGGNDGTLHHVWAYVRCGGKWWDCDLTEPGYRLGDHSGFEAYEEVEVEL